MSAPVFALGDIAGDVIVNMPADAWPAAEPLPTALPPVAAFDLDLLPDTLRPWIVDISERIQCPPEFPAIGALVACAAIIGRQIAIRPKCKDDWTVVPNLWGSIVGRPGLLKTPALAEVMKPLDRLEAKAREAHDAAMTEHRASELVRRVEVKEYEAAIKKAKGADRKRVALDAVKNEANAAPARVRYSTSDTTVEKLGELLRDNPRGVLVFRDELTGWLSNLDREGREGTRAFFLESWNGTGRYTFDRIGRGTIDVEAACVSVLGGIQPGPLSDYLAATRRGGRGDDGLLQRFQLIVWPDVTGAWRNVDRWPDSAAKKRAHAAIDRLDALYPTALGARQDEGEPIPCLRFSDAGQTVFDEWRAALEARLRTGDMAPTLEAHLAKFRSLLPSLALLFHLLDAADGGPVSEAATLRAAAWCDYLESHAQRLYSSALDPALDAARELDRHLLRGDLSDPFTARDVYRHCWRLLDRNGTVQALEYLADAGRIAGREADTGGRSSVEWRLNPTLRRVEP